jgi:putative membrane protein
MLIQLLFFLFIGIIVGTITGLIPGIHINLIGVFLISLSVSLFSSINPIYLIVFIAAMAITHTFLDFIPSIFLGCPDTDTELSILPGHELLKKGQGYMAILLTAYGSLAATFTIILISFPATLIIEKIHNLLTKPYVMPSILIFISLLLIVLERKKAHALFVFLLTGALGLSVLNLKVEQPLLPLLTGLFGASMLTLGIKNKTQIPKQKIKAPSKNITKPVAGAFLGSLIASPLCSFLPGLGSGQAAIIGNLIAKTNKKGFLILLGATNTLVMGFSFISLYAISKTRTGAAVAIQQLIGQFSWKILILIIATVFISGIVSFFLTKSLAKFFSKNINKINYTKLSLITLSILTIVIFLVSNFAGLIILVVSTLTGIYCISLNVKRTNMMGCLLIPTIILYLL